MRNLRVASTALALVLALLPAAADAAVESKIYPGSLCKPANSALGYDVAGQNTYSGYSQNYPGRIGVVCPVVRDQVTGTTPVSAYLSVYDPNSTGFVWCAIFSANATAGTISYGTQSTTAAQVGNTYLNMSTGTGSSWYDAITVVCNLDQNARIYSYNIDETVQQD